MKLQNISFLLLLVLLQVGSLSKAYGDVLATKEAFDAGTGAPLTAFELGQTVEYGFNWSCNFTGTPPPGECGDFVLTDPLPAGVTFVSCSVPGIYSCNFDGAAGPAGTVTIEAVNPAELFTNGQSATASIIVQLSTDESDFPGGTASPLVNTATTTSADGNEDIMVSAPINPPANNWEVSKSVLVPAAPVQPALDNDVQYEIEVCPNGPAGLGVGTIIIDNPVITDSCPVGATIVGATLNGAAITPTGACPAVNFPLPTTFDPADGCQVLTLTLQYPSANFSNGAMVTNGVELNGDNIDPATCPSSNCNDTAVNTLVTAMPDAEIDKSALRAQTGVGAFNRFNIDFDTTNSNVVQTGVEINDVFPAGMDPLQLSHSGAWSDSTVTADIIELGTNTTVLAGFNGGMPALSHTFTAGGTGFAVVFNTPVPPGFDGGRFEVTLNSSSTLTVGDSFENCAQVSSDQILPANNPEACSTVTIINPTSDLQLNKVMPDGVSPGATFTTRFDFIQSDTSTVGAVNPVIADCIPSDLEFVSWDSLAFTGLDDPRNAVNISNSLPIGVEPNFELFQPGDAGNTCADPTRTFIRWSWKASAPAGSTKLDGTAGVANPFTFPVRRDRLPATRDNIGDASGLLGLFIRVRMLVTMRVKPGVAAQNGLSNSVEAIPENTDFRCLGGASRQTTDSANIDGNAATTQVCTRTENYNILSSAAFSGNKFVAGFPGLPNFDPANPPVDNTPAASTGIATPASCPTDADGRTRTPCVAQAMKDQPFNYRIRLSNDGNVELRDYVVYDILPHTDSAGSDTGISEAQAATVRGSSWVPLLNGPVNISSANPVIATELANNSTLEYSASTNPCRPELSINNDTLGGDWQAGACVDDWTETPLADATTFPNGYASVRAWRLNVPFATNAWPVGDPNNQLAEDIVVNLEMLADPTAPPSDYEAVPNPVLQIAWNNVAFRATNESTGRRLLAAELIKTGIVMPAEYPLMSTGLRIGNLVWVDADNDGLAEAGEQGIFDVTVQLWNDITGDGPTPDDSLYDTTQTDAEGHYLFDDANLLNRDGLGLPAGDYYVAIPSAQTGSFVFDENYSSTTDEENADANLDNDDNGAFDSNDLVTPVPGLNGIYSGTVNLTLGAEPTNEQLRSNTATDDDDDFFDDNDSNVSVDFGFYQLRLGNHVWLDTNNDGDADNNEPAIENMQVQLFLDADPDGAGPLLPDGIFDPDVDTLLDTDTTNAAGQYLFEGLDVGNYFVAIPSGQVGLDADGTGYSSNQLASSSATSAAGAALSGDNADDGAPGTFGSTTPVTYASVSTLLSLTVGGAQTGERDSSQNGITGNSSTDASAANVELTENIAANAAFPDTNSYLTADFGFTTAVSLGSTVWIDIDADGTQDVGEASIANATVTLLNASGVAITDATGNPITALTDANGQYNFNQLTPGTYRVSVDLSTSTVPNIEDYIPSPVQVPDPNNDSNTDSNIDFAVDPTPTDQVFISGDIVLTVAGEPTGETDPINAAGTGALADPDQPNQTGLNDSSGNMTLDMGFVPPVSLGSTLWVDDGDGIQELGEAPIVNARVTLLNGDGSVFDSNPYVAGIQSSTTTTDADGQYNFDGLPPGDYRVSVDLTGATNSNATALIPTLVNVPDANANPLLAATNLDSNVDTDNANNNATTDVWVSELVSLSVGGEVTGETDPIGAGGADQPNQGLIPADDPDASGNMTLDMGFIEPVSLGSTAWFDSDSDGRQDSGEPAIVGATITLLNSNGTVYDRDLVTAGVQPLTDVTDTEGQYNFNGLAAGDYRVQVDLNTATSHVGGSLNATPLQVADPDAAGPGQDNNTDSNVDSTAPGHNPAGNIYQSGVVTLSVGGEPAGEVDPIGAGGADQPNQTATEQPDANGNMTVDFGFFAPVSLGSTIWNDSDADGVQDAGEPAIAGATITVLNPNGTVFDSNPNVAGIQALTDVTDADGQYNFNNLIPGDYRVQVNLGTVTGGDDYLPTPLQVADPDAAGSGQDNNTDSNVDTAFDTNVNDLIHTSGVVTLTVGGEPTGETDPIGAGGADQPNQGLTATNEPDNSGNMTVDMGFIRPVSLGSTLWLDSDEDGFQDAAEPGIVGATVTLLNSNGTVYDSNPNVAGIQPFTDTTDADGQYNFNDIPEGDYRVQVNLAGATNTGAATFVPSPRQVADPDAAGPGQDNNTDSNVDRAFDTNTADQIHTSGVITLSVGGEPTGETDSIGAGGADQPNQGLTASNQPDANGNMTVDFGFIEPVSIGSSVWFDSDSDGTQDAGEPAIVGATITVLNADGTVYDSDPVTAGIQSLTDVTDTDGQYNFNSLPEGDYRVQVDLNTATSHVGGSLNATPLQVADPDAAGPGQDNNTDSNVDSTAPGHNPAGNIYQSGVVTLSVGGEPTGEVDPIGAGGADQPNQTAAQPDNSGNMTVDFGFLAPVSLGSTIWEDLDGDGTQDALELAIVGATVTVLNPNGTVFDSNPNVAGIQALTDVTDADGQYNFDDLIPGDYRVQVDLSTVTGGSDLFPSPVQVADPDAAGPGQDNNTDSNIDTVFDTNTADQIHASGIVTLSPGSEPTSEVDPIGAGGADQPNQGLTATDDPDNSGNMTVDMGFVRPVSVGSTIWQDNNLNGAQDDTEPPIVGATVTLLNAAGTPVAGVAPVVTDATGQYNFDGLPPGDYRIQVNLSTVAGGQTLIPSPVQVADPDAAGPGQDNNTDSNVDVPFDTNTADQIHTSGVVTLTAGVEPTGEVDFIDGIDGNAAVPDQPNQGVTDPDNSGNMTVDMAFYAPVSIGSFVWEDLDGDGLQDAGEPPLAGAMVELLLQTGPGVFATPNTIAGPPVSIVTVGADGLYEFSNLLPGDYKVRVTPPAGVFPSPVQNTTPNDDSPNDSNIAVELAGNVVESAVFTINVGSEPNEAGPDTNRGDAQDGVAGGLDDLSGNMTIDFAFVPSASLGNYVWLDLDMDGIQDANEEGIANVTVNLYQDTNEDGVINGAEATTPVATATTGPNGEYLFPNLEPGVVYQTGVDVSTLTTGLVQTYDENDGAGATDSLSGPITLDPGEFHETADFGYAPATGIGAVGDTIWVDADDDGVQDPGEPGIAGVTVSITPAPGVDLGSGPGIAITTVTDSNGRYLFPNLPLNNTYIVEVDIATLPTGYVSGPSNLGDPDVRDGNSTTADNQTTVVITAANPVNLDLDFGYLPPASQNNSIGDTIWIDADRDGEGPSGANTGVDTTEQVIPGVTVSLLNSSGDVIATTITDNNGQYLFTGLPDGMYTVVVSDQNNVLNGLEQTYDNDDGVNASPTTPGRSAVDLDSAGASAAPVNNRDQDFGYVDASTSSGVGQIGDTIFFDSNGSGAPDAGEGLEGVVVQLYGPGPDGIIGNADDVLIGTETTDENGNYLFTGLDVSDTGPNPGTDYRVEVVQTSLPNGSTGWVNSVDPDTVGTGNNQSTTTLSNTTPSDLDQDFGYVSDDMNSLSGTIWPDTDGDGELAESGRFGGVTVELRDSDGNVIQTTTTDVNGDFMFENLPDGVYTVVVTDDDNVLNGFEHTDSPNGLSDTGDSTSKDDTGYTVDLDSTGASSTPVSDSTSDFGYMPVITNPISLGSFNASSAGEGQVLIEWTTQTEVANLGFKLYGRVDDEWVLLNSDLILGQGDSVSTQYYETSVATEAAIFVIADIDLTGTETLHGPFQLGKPYGGVTKAKVIDWAAEKADREKKALKRATRRVNQQKARMLKRAQKQVSE